jgi:hypothetical protein
MDCADWYAWVRSVDFAMSETGALYTQWPTFRCFGAIDALGHDETFPGRSEHL